MSTKETREAVGVEAVEAAMIEAGKHIADFSEMPYVERVQLKRNLTEVLQAALPYLQKQFRDQLRDQLDGLDWQAVNTDAEQQCPSRDHRPFACAKCVVEAALKATPTATEEAG